MNPNENYYYWHGHQIQNYSPPMESDFEGQTTSLDPSVFFEPIPIQYDFDFNEMGGHSGHYGHQSTVATSSHQYISSDPLQQMQNQQNDFGWMQQTFVNEQNSENVPLDANAMEIQQLTEGVAAVNVGKSARKRKIVLVKGKGRGGKNAVGMENKKRKQERTLVQIKAQKETKIKNNKTIKELEEKEAEEIIQAIGNEGIERIHAGFVKACKYNKILRRDKYNYFKNVIAKILFRTMKGDRQKLVDLFTKPSAGEYSEHIWAAAKENKNAKKISNKEFTMNIFVYKKQFSLAELIIMLRKKVFMENGELARFKPDPSCKVKKMGRQCINPGHWFYNYTCLDDLLYKERLKLEKNGGKFDEEKEKLLEGFKMKIWADENEEGEGSDYSAEE